MENLKGAKSEPRTQSSPRTMSAEREALHRQYCDMPTRAVFAELDAERALTAELVAALELAWPWLEGERRKHNLLGEENEAEHMGGIADAAKHAIAKARTQDSPRAQQGGAA